LRYSRANPYGRKERLPSYAIRTYGEERMSNDSSHIFSTLREQEFYHQSVKKFKPHR